MATANEEIRDGLVRHQVGLLRYARGLERRLIAIINRAEPELRAALKARIERAAALGFDTGPATTKRLKRILLTYQTLMKPVWREIRRLGRDELLELAQDETKFLSQLIVASLPVDFEPILPTRAELRQILTSTPVEGRYLDEWFATWERNDRERAMSAVRTGILFSETPTQISRRIFGSRSLRGGDGARQLTRRGAQVFAQTMTSAVTNQAKQSVYLKNERFVKKELYVATLDSRTTPICRSLDGNEYKVGDGPIPPLHVNCRSVRVPAMDSAALASRPSVAVTDRQLRGLRGKARRRRVEELVGQVPGDTTYQEWLKSQSASFQDEVLGPTRGRLFRKGELTLDRFVDESGDQYTLEQLRQRESAAFRKAGI